ncbi:squalene cyclase [Tessaracoccus coleopterorum]|uniref:squalene cyclase n=1 Tax=Tessaracoccus coleopterorum TaxID=2714950 RepID=UPI001E50B6A6|nr:squalene cyclase [Tessaracoccus coleopterorum]
MRDDIIEWLLDSDPALQWQVERDLDGAPEAQWRETRARVVTEGIGAGLLALQGEDGLWAGGSFFPAAFDFEHPGEGQPWTATTWSLNSLREWGVDASVLGDTASRIDANARWEYDSLPYWGGEVDVCINAFTLANGSWLGADVSALRGWFPEHQLGDGGWNCEWVDGSTRSSVQSTLNAVKGILNHEIRTGDTTLREPRLRGQEYLLERRLLWRASDGGQIAPWVDKFAYPFRGFYSALTALDHFRTASLHDGVTPDPRLGTPSTCSGRRVARTAGGCRPDGTRATCGSRSTSTADCRRGG